jgi:Bacterial SH3 domain
VYLRNSPHDGDRSGVLAENTPLTITGEPEEGDGQNWLPVRTPDGNTGYVPVNYTTSKDPQAPPAPVVPDQAR